MNDLLGGWESINLAGAVGGIKGSLLTVITPTSGSQLCLRRVGRIEMKDPEFEFPGCQPDSDRERVPVQSQNMIVSMLPCGALLKWCRLSTSNNSVPKSLGPLQNDYVHLVDEEPGCVAVNSAEIGCSGSDPRICLHEACPRSS